MSANRRTEDLMLSGRSFIKIRNRISPKTDPWGTSNNTGTGSEAWPSNTAQNNLLIKTVLLCSLKICFG